MNLRHDFRILKDRHGKDLEINYRKEAGGKDLGKKIASLFAWKQIELSDSPMEEHYRLEIEAFPIDKWIEFKNHLFNEINECHKHNTPINGRKVLEAIKQLEFYGKPAGEAKESSNDH